MMLYWCVWFVCPQSVCVCVHVWNKIIGGRGQNYIQPPILCPSCVIHIFNIPKQVFPISSVSVSTQPCTQALGGCHHNSMNKKQDVQARERVVYSQTDWFTALSGVLNCMATAGRRERETRWGREGGGVLGEERGRRSYKTKSHIESESIFSPCPGVVEVSTTMVRVELSCRVVAGFG